MQNNKSPGNNEVIKEFFITCWTEEKMLNQKKKSSIPQRQIIVKLVKKKDKDKRLIKNWRPIPKALAARLKKVLSSLISP